MLIREITNKVEWPATQSFLQSWEWGEFQKSVGVPARRFIIGKTAAQVFIYKVAIGIFWYLPHSELSENEYKALCEFAKTQKIFFIRVESYEPIDRSLSGVRLPLGSLEVRHRQPEHTSILDLNKSADTLLSTMHPKTRYNIRLAEKKGLTVSLKKNSVVFNSLLLETCNRDGFKSHPPDYYSAMLNCPLIEQITVSDEGTPLASAIFIGYNGTYTYLHGASATAHREFKASHLVQWRGILHAMKNGFEKYDFWGVAPDDSVNHSWAGITRFKIGFGGARETRGPAFEIPVKKMCYRILRIVLFILNLLKFYFCKIKKCF